MSRVGVRFADVRKAEAMAETHENLRKKYTTLGEPYSLVRGLPDGETGRVRGHNVFGAGQ